MARRTDPPTPPAPPAGPGAPAGGPADPPLTLRQLAERLHADWPKRVTVRALEQELWSCCRRGKMGVFLGRLVLGRWQVRWGEWLAFVEAVTAPTRGGESAAQKSAAAAKRAARVQAEMQECRDRGILKDRPARPASTEAKS